MARTESHPVVIGQCPHEFLAVAAPEAQFVVGDRDV
jgi:hypothetical protein